MDLNFTIEQERFRQEVRTFLSENLSAELACKVDCGESLSRQDYEDWHAVLNRRGWLAWSWPSEFGGTGWSVVERHIFSEECALASAPRIVPFGITMMGPVLIQYGTDQQKAELLPRILDGRDWWCQGFSEPGSGSDLASLKTRADRDGDEYIVNGQKIWTTLGQNANKIFCLVRTAKTEKPQFGISFLLIDLDTPGIEMRPIKLLDGGHDVNEVFFTDARVPVSNLVGEEHQGWTVTKYLLAHERTNIAGIGFSIRDLERYKELAARSTRDGVQLKDHTLFGFQIAEIEADLEALRVTNLRMLSKAMEGSGVGYESSLLKIKGTEIRQRLQSLYRQALGHQVAFNIDGLSDDELPLDPASSRAAAVYLNHRKLSIYGGSNEIQRNIIAKQLFRG